MVLATSKIDWPVSPLPISRLIRQRQIEYRIRLFPYFNWLNGLNWQTGKPLRSKIMTEKIISIEQQDGPFQKAFQRVMRMVPDRDKQDKKLQRLIAFRLRIDGEAALSEYLIKKIKTAIKCSYSGSMYDYLKDDLVAKECEDPDADEPPPGVA